MWVAVQMLLGEHPITSLWRRGPKHAADLNKQGDFFSSVYSYVLSSFFLKERESEKY